MRLNKKKTQLTFCKRLFWPQTVSYAAYTSMISLVEINQTMNSKKIEVELIVRDLICPDCLF